MFFIISTAAVIFLFVGFILQLAEAK